MPFSSKNIPCYEKDKKESRCFPISKPTCSENRLCWLASHQESSVNFFHKALLSLKLANSLMLGSFKRETITMSRRSKLCGLDLLIASVTCIMTHRCHRYF